MTDDLNSPGCPDGGACHHACTQGACFRVQSCGPLSGVYPQDRWPDDVRAAHGGQEARTALQGSHPTTEAPNGRQRGTRERARALYAALLAADERNGAGSPYHQPWLAPMEEVTDWAYWERIVLAMDANTPPPGWGIIGTWLVEQVDACTCDGGYDFPHRPECGWEPVVDLSTLAGWADLAASRAVPSDHTATTEDAAQVLAAQEHARNHGLDAHALWTDEQWAPLRDWYMERARPVARALAAAGLLATARPDPATVGEVRAMAERRYPQGSRVYPSTAYVTGWLDGYKARGGGDRA